MRFSSLFAPTHVICHTSAQDRNTILLELLRKLAYERGIGNVAEVFRQVVAREDRFPTIVGAHFAMPHARVDSVDRIVVGVATSEEGFVYARKGDEEFRAKLMILTLAPKDAPGAYLSAMASLARVCQDPETADKIARLQSPEEVWRFFDTGGLVLPDHLLARDVMGPCAVRLLEHDTLERAIDLFVQHRLRELPVVDKDDELVGVVTTYELLRVCLPDYILWMDDLRPIMNFEPFAEVLRKESNTWLAEIMTSDYAAVDEMAPAIQVAKEITRQHAGAAYVVRGKKLVGAVSLVGLLDKIMRE
jgi:CBS domain-containing protein